MHGILRRLVVPALLLACVGIEWHRGGDLLPTWVANLSVKVGAGPDRALRIILALQILGAAVALASRGGSRIVAWAAGAALAFSGLAELSAIVAAPGKAAVPAGTWVAPLLGLAIGEIVHEPPCILTTPTRSTCHLDILVRPQHP